MIKKNILDIKAKKSGITYILTIVINHIMNVEIIDFCIKWFLACTLQYQPISLTIIKKMTNILLILICIWKK